MRFRIAGLTTSAAAAPITATGNDAAVPAAEHRGPNDTEIANEKEARIGDAASRDSSDDDASLEKLDTNAEHGVQAIQAMTQVWSKSHILIAYVMYDAPKY